MDKIIFFNVGWMDFYSGVLNDNIKGGGSYVKAIGWGHEIFNFKEFESNYYGYVQPKIDNKYKSECVIKLEKIGGSKADDKIDNVYVVWTATNPNKVGTYIIGWYKNATVFRKMQKLPMKSNRIWNNTNIGFYATAKINNSKLLKNDERLFQVIRGKKNWMGQSNVWYAESNLEYRKQVFDYILNGINPKSLMHRQKGISKKLDPLKRLEVEKKAVIFVENHYRKYGYEIESVEKDNVGWDLNAVYAKIKLKLEVKGLSGKDISTELTPNEYTNLKANNNNYRICIVTEALSSPSLKIFAYSKDNNKWISEDGLVLNFEDKTGAKIYSV